MQTNEHNDNLAEQHIFQLLLSESLMEANIMSIAVEGEGLDEVMKIPQWKLRFFPRSISLIDCMNTLTHDERVGIYEHMYGKGVSTSSDVRRQIHTLSEDSKELWDDHEYGALFQLIFRMVETIFDVDDTHFESYKESDQMRDDFSEATSLITKGLEALQDTLHDNLLAYVRNAITIDEVYERMVQGVNQVHDALLAGYQGKVYTGKE